MRRALDHYRSLVALMVDTQRFELDDDWDALLGFASGDREALAEIAANAAIEAGVASSEVLRAEDYANACEAFSGAVTALAVQHMGAVQDLGGVLPEAFLARLARTHVVIPEHRRAPEFSFVIVPSGFLVAITTFLRLRAKLAGTTDSSMDPIERLKAQAAAIDRAFNEDEKRSFQWVIGATAGLTLDRMGGSCDMPMSLGFHATMTMGGLQVWEELGMGAGIGGAEGLPPLDEDGISAARGILAFATLHELGHALLSRSGTPRPERGQEEILCDRKALLLGMLVARPLQRFHSSPDFQAWMLDGFFPVMQWIKLAHILASSGGDQKVAIHVREYETMLDRAFAASKFVLERVDGADDPALAHYVRAHLASVHALTDNAYAALARRIS
jgi:hypothetical protein